MMPNNLTFYKISERQPHENQIIWLLHQTYSPGIHGFKCGKVGYSYPLFDEQGYCIGNYAPEEGKPMPTNCKLVMFLEGTSICQYDLWAPYDEIHSHLPDIFKD